MCSSVITNYDNEPLPSKYRRQDQGLHPLPLLKPNKANQHGLRDPGIELGWSEFAISENMSF